LNLLFLLLAAAQATDTTYNLTAGQSSWTFTGLTSSNPDIFAAIGDTLTFNIAGGNMNTLFALHRTQGSNASSDRYPNSSETAASGSSLVVTIGMDVAPGSTLFYEDESNPMTLSGRLCILLDNCMAMNTCGGPCVTCAIGFGLTQGGTCGPLASVPCPSPLPDPNCNTASCWMSSTGVEVQCTACASGFWINSSSLCQACRQSCSVGSFISAPCGTFNDIVCSTCTPCSPGQVLVTPCPGNGTTDNTMCSGSNPSPEPEPEPEPEPSPSGNCNPPPNCKTAECWSEDDIQCTECDQGYFIDSTQKCTTCSNCSSGNYISWPCEGYTDTVCSPCYSSACGPCQVGYTLDLYGLCVAQLCMLYGCGAANVDVVCKEYSDTTFICVCPVEQVSYVAANTTTFQGCSSSGNGSGNQPQPPINQVLASVNTTHLEAFLVNGMEQILGAAIVSVNGNTFTLNINATVPIDGLTAELEKEIANFLGAGYTANDISVQYVARKRNTNGQVVVSVSGQASGVTSVYVPITAFLIGLLTIVTLR